MNAVSHRLHTVSNDTYINAVSVCDLLYKVAAAYPNLPRTLILDNARYQKCALVRETAEALNIELLYLPAYSPNLNLIERLWKFVKKQCLYSKYYDTYDAFKATIQSCLNTAHTKHHDALESLLTHNFQSFEDAQYMAV